LYQDTILDAKGGAGDHLREGSGQMPLVKKTGKPVLSPDEEPQQEE
jgi:hypothetical protein